MGDYSKTAKDYVDQLTVDMYGVEQVVKLCLVALFTDGHVLLEGNPGLGKTALVKAFEDVMGFQFGRIQFTPDLMPSDITGTLMPRSDNSSQLQFQAGPIFTTLLLADEINRATPKTQAAMLEAMAERQVTVLGKTHSLTGPNKDTQETHSFRPFLDENHRAIRQGSPRPFMVLATQNPVEHEGTYELPEAQADRFMFKILMPTPDESALQSILTKTTAHRSGGRRDGGSAGWETESQLQLRHDRNQRIYLELRDEIKKVTPAPSVEKHIANLFLATNGRVDELRTIDARSQDRLKVLVKALQFGLGPRAAIALLLGAKGWSKLFVPEVDHADGRSLAQVALPVLRHRIHLTYEGRREVASQNPGGEADRVVDAYLRELLEVTAPTVGATREERAAFEGYRQSFATVAKDVVARKAC